MRPTRRTVLAAAGAGLAAPALAPALAGAPDDAAPGLLRLSAEANAALLRGDVDAYRALVTLADDFLLMSPFGGRPTPGAEVTAETWEGMRRFFRDGTLEVDLAGSWSTPDMVALALVERAEVAVGGLPRQPWALRVTLVYRRDGDAWRLVHRHADPLAHGIDLAEAAALASGPAG
ncbi:nuclear transport factor 2 family protein [Amaricoccus sp.]|uniref:YybH family protein n=1 Tax=Amaricoccus sp. TaxID=1872485 RepID=UPI001B6A80A5|nr:nuclear transport factor 2 family protein [Amaricoccus sp.]MBP7001063.1 nuclear transport factor 2 family protein [Amaricoccus sp.]